MQENNLEEIKYLIEEFFKKFGFLVEINVFLEEKTIFCKINYFDPSFLIGKNGQTLFNIQHLISRIIKKKNKDDFFFDLDINDYKDKKTQYLKELAQEIADEVSSNKIAKELPFLSAYERRIVHLELAGRNDVIAQSIGEGQERRLIIKPAP